MAVPFLDGFPYFPNAAGGTLRTCAAGTTTNIATYTDQGGGTANANPIPLDASGYPESGGIWLTAGTAYRFFLYDSSGTLVREEDNVSGATTTSDLASVSSATAGASLVGFSPTLAYAARTHGNATVYGSIPSIFWYLSQAQQADVLAGTLLEDLTSAIIAALADSPQLYFPPGSYLISGSVGITLGVDGSMIVGAGVSTLIKYTGTGTGIDFNGKDHCQVSNLRLWAPSAAIGIDVGDVSHYFKVIGCHLRGSSTGSDVGGTVSSGIGISVERSYYGEISGNDISYFTKGVYGFREFNGNAIALNSIRQCYRAVHITDATSNSEGSCIVQNTIESAQASSVAGVDIEGADGMIVAHNRIELSGGSSTAHIYVHGGSGAAIRNQIVDNYCTGTDASIVIGSGSGSNNVVNTVLRDGYYNTSVTINSDADYTHVDLDRLQIADGSLSLSDSSPSATRSIISYVDDSGFTASVTGLTTTPTSTWKFRIANNIVTVFGQTLNGTSNSTACTITGLPALIRPTNSQSVLCMVQDNGIIGVGKAVIDSSGVMTLSPDAAGSAFTAANGKGFIGTTFTYSLN